MRSKPRFGPAPVCKAAAGDVFHPQQSLMKFDRSAHATSVLIESETEAEPPKPTPEDEKKLSEASRAAQDAK